MTSIDNILRLHVNDGAARQVVEAAVMQLLRDGGPEPRLTVHLDGDRLPAPVVAGLVAGLRRLRDVGGAMAVNPSTPALRDAMALHGLDRVFAFPLDPEGTSPRPRRRGFFNNRAMCTAG